jgi:hypothetical protein
MNEKGTFSFLRCDQFADEIFRGGTEEIDEEIVGERGGRAG